MCPGVVIVLVGQDQFCQALRQDAAGTKLRFQLLQGARVATVNQNRVPLPEQENRMHALLHPIPGVAQA